MTPVLVIDLEATCDDADGLPASDMEIIEIGAVWASVGVGVSVHALSCFGLVHFGTAEQRAEWLPDMLGGGLIGGYSLSEPQAGSDAAALRCRAERDGDAYVVTGTKSWITHGGIADVDRAVEQLRTGARNSA